MGSSQAWQERIYCLKNPSRLWKYVSAIYIPAARDYFNRLVGSSRLNNKHRQRVLATPARAFLLVYLVALSFDPCPLQDFSALLIWTWCCNVHVACTHALPWSHLNVFCIMELKHVISAQHKQALLLHILHGGQEGWWVLKSDPFFK